MHLAVLRVALMVVLVGCAGPPPPPPTPALVPPTAPGTPPSATARATPSSSTTNPGSTPPNRMTTPQTITIPTNAKRTVLGLEIEVVDNTEKREMDGTGLMRVGLRVRGPKGEFPVHLTSAKGETTKTVEGYTFEYLGGWRTEVELRVTPPPAP